MAALAFDFPALASAPLCVADFRVEGGIMPMGQSPWTARRIGYVTGGRFEGPRLTGEILPGGGNWSTSGEIAPGEAAGTFDARVVWKTHDGALIYVTYTGRTVVSEAVSARFRDPAAPEVPHGEYYIRIAPVFETADPRYAWLNGVLAVGCGHRTDTGIRHSIFAIL
ncbi:DUF3237 domain-containing protein [Phenylobacterium sp.]|uniref:DUF3237 domain-containing protein n=1 Tax=Phenylobacterium sp. TaxID=1871053 RepID=UPI0025DFDEEF|nr:DUF3237 domain-containing protein [Phenylobacterium sp.]